MDEELFKLILNWIPMLLLIAVWVWFLTRMRGGKGYQNQILEEYRRQNATLERIAAALERRA